MRNYIIVLCSVFLFSLLSCVDEAPPFTVPYAPVFFKLELNGLDSDLAFFDYKTFSQGRTIGERTGYGGLLVFRTHEGNIFAYDLCCPHEDDKNTRVQPTDNGKALCPGCGSVFVTMYGLGSVESGPSSESLQHYTVSKYANRDGVLIITN